jgi:hypothetical protein
MIGLTKMVICMVGGPGGKPDCYILKLAVLESSPPKSLFANNRLFMFWLS